MTSRRHPARPRAARRTHQKVESKDRVEEGRRGPGHAHMPTRHHSCTMGISGPLIQTLSLLGAHVAVQTSGVAASAFVSDALPRYPRLPRSSFTSCDQYPRLPSLDSGIICAGYRKESVLRYRRYRKVRPTSVSNSFVAHATKSALASAPCQDCSSADREATPSHSHSHPSGLNHLTLLSIFFWLVSMTSFAHARFHKLQYAGILSFFLGLPTLVPKVRRAILVNRKVDASCMMLGASIGAVLLGDYAEAAAVSSLFAVSEVLEERASERSEEALSAVARDLGPDTARVLRVVVGEEGNNVVETKVPANEVVVGSSISVPVGDKVPCDGIITTGSTTFDESLISGESRPVQCSVGDSVPAGAINSGPTRIVLRTTARSDESTVARLAKLVEDSRRQKSRTETAVNRMAALYAPPVFFAALLACTVSWLFGPTVGRTWSKRGLVTMVAACPCPLVISTPVTYVAGLANAARSGIVLKGGAVLEALGKVTKVALDKTGTITEGKFALRNLKVADGADRERVLKHLALIESPSAHPLATALVQAANREGINVSKDVTVSNHTILEGEGVTANIGGKAVLAGNARLFQRLGLLESPSEADRELVRQWASKGETVGFMSIEDEGIVCSYSIADGIRAGAKDSIRQLHDMGVNVIMLTGDRHEAAKSIGDQVGLSPEQVYSDLLPKEKLNIISGMKIATKGSVLMCGDGVNDAPALALADVGVAMGGGAALATETSDVTLTDQDLNKLVYSIKLGRRAVRTITQNIAFSLAAKAVVVGLAAFGIQSLWAAIASDVGTMLIVTGNGLRLLPSVSEKGSRNVS